MMIHDYSNLLKAISELQTEKKQEENRIECEKENRILELEHLIVASGMLYDWKQLKLTCKKIGVRIMPHGDWNEVKQGPLMKASNYFRDSGAFCSSISSGSHWSDYFGFYGNDAGEIVWKYFHTTNTHLIDKLDKCRENDEKLFLLELFLKEYEEYKRIQLDRVFTKMGQLAYRIQSLKEK